MSTSVLPALSLKKSTLATLQQYSLESLIQLITLIKMTIHTARLSLSLFPFCTLISVLRLPGSPHLLAKEIHRQMHC